MNTRMRRDPDAGMGMFDHWFECDPPPPRDAGMGIFDHWFEFDPKPGPDAGMGIFSHYGEDYEISPFSVSRLTHHPRRPTLPNK